MSCTYRAAPRLANSDTWSSPPSLQPQSTVNRESHTQGSQDLQPPREQERTPYQSHTVHGWLAGVGTPSDSNTPSLRSFETKYAPGSASEDPGPPAQAPEGDSPPKGSG